MEFQGSKRKIAVNGKQGRMDHTGNVNSFPTDRNKLDIHIMRNLNCTSAVVLMFLV